LHWTSYATGNERPVQTSYKPSDFGLPTYLNDKAGDATQVPTLTFSSLNSLSDTYPTINSRGNTGQLKSAFTYVKAADNTTTASNQGLEFASFLMGLPSAVSIDTNDSGIFSTRYRAFYLQDDWRISSRLHLSPGLRYEREGGITEGFNRGLGGRTGRLRRQSLAGTSCLAVSSARRHAISGYEWKSHVHKRNQSPVAPPGSGL
jgi:outer membrane receptor protein involved in Fe transport